MSISQNIVHKNKNVGKDIEKKLENDIKNIYFYN